LNELPLVVSKEKERWQVYNNGYCRRNSLEIVTSNYIIEAEFPIFSVLEKYLVNLLHSGGTVILGVFALPYLLVPENKDIVQLYNKLIQKYPQYLKKCSLFFLVLCDYSPDL
jgi:hypothetical protein